ncbi:GNAT family N-acetyltransferase [Granulicella sp. L46]|uniref:GNAT family N-acetyltransferase n=1 Tax=Granulicella sp. L46 TaxID=1641865 RepID=UPI00131D6185|nr:GNAT family N-acetyltransferase [Granulicella sp. L46]
MNPTLETERLILRPLELGDAERIQELFGQWEIVRLLNARVPWPFPEGGALENIRDTALPGIERGEQWDWTLRLKTETETIIGRIGLYLGENNRGFWMGLPWQGQGLMTEAVIAVTDYWFEVLGFPVMRVPKAVENVGSRRISEKTGMRVVEVKESEYVSGRLQTEVWEITAEEWWAWRRT